MKLRTPFVAAIWLILAISGCSKNSDKAQSQAMAQPLLDKLAHAPESDLPSLVYGYEPTSAGGRQVLLKMLKPFHAPSPEQNMTVVAVRQSGAFTMIVARVPWLKDSQQSTLLPVLVTSMDGKEVVAGMVMPFDDIRPLIPQKDLADVSDLTMWWISEYANKK